MTTVEPRGYLTPAAIARLANLSLVARLVVEGATSGLHKSPYFGSNVEFSEYRRYQPGDELRHVDWKLYAKTDRYYIKRYEETTSLRSVVLLDVSESMTFGGGPLSKLEYGKCLAAAVGYLVLHQKDSVGLGTFSDRLHELVPPSARPSHLGRMVECLGRAHGSGRTDLAAVLRDLGGRLKRRSLVVIISDLFDEPERVVNAVRHLQFQKHEVALFRVLAAEEVEFPYEEYSRFVDLEDGSDLLLEPRALANEYRSKMAEYLLELRRRLSHAKVDLELFRTDRPLEETLARFLTRRARRRSG